MKNIKRLILIAASIFFVASMVFEPVMAGSKNKKIVVRPNTWDLTEWQHSYAQMGVPFEKESFTDRKKEFKYAYKNFQIGLELYQNKRRVEAIPFLQQAYEFNPDNLLLNYVLGRSYYISALTRWDSEKYIVKALSIDSLNKDATYLLGRLSTSKYLLDSAIGLYERCLKLPHLEASDSINYYARIKECNIAKISIKKPERVFIDNLGNTLNTAYPDYAPILSQDGLGLYFTSIRPGSTGSETDIQTGLCFEDVYKATREDVKDTLWVVENLGSPVNTEGHDASAGLSPDNTDLYIYKGYKGVGNIYESKLDSIDWKKPRMVDNAKEMSSKKFDEKTVSFSFDSREMFFISDREGGYGGLDIWYCKKDTNGRWGDPMNMGPVINTPKNEMSVFVMPDGKSLFFSSNGHETMGGLDILYSKKEDTAWSIPTRLGYPINTVENDLFYTRSLDGKTAYYASERMQESMGGFDIYKVTYMGDEKGVVTQSEDQLLAYMTMPISEIVAEAAAEIKVTPITLLKGFVYDDFSKKPLRAQVIMVDNDLNQQIAVFESNAVSGKFMVTLPAGHNYGITVKCEGYLFHSENFDIPAESEYTEVKKDFPLKNVSVGSVVVLRNIFYEIDKATLLPASYNEMERLYILLSDAPGLKIEISGHTDNTGSAAHNQTLSEKRAKSVVDYLTARGIDPSRLVSKGYGMIQPMSSNDTPDGRAQNRRTEFKIIENDENIKK